MTLKVAKIYTQIISQHTEDVQLLSLEDHNIWERNDAFKALEQRYLIPATKFALIMPEYNGSFPGVLKLLMDNSDIKKCWWHKKVMLTGVADGRGGNLRGIEHMTNILHYLKMNVFYNKIPLSRINEEMDDAGNLLKPATVDAINEQIIGFVNY